MRRNWIKLYVDQTLRGSCFDELLPDERFVWFGFLLLAGDNALEGKICITEKMGYTNEQLAELLKCKKELIERSIKKMIKHKKIKVCNGNIVQILNWGKYQSDYQRQKPHRDINFIKIRDFIKERDNYTCLNCNKNEDDLEVPLCIHHIDNNPENNSPDNLITLCMSCHSQLLKKNVHKNKSKEIKLQKEKFNRIVQQNSSRVEREGDIEGERDKKEKKKKKEKEKKDKYADFVLMTKEEYQKLVKEYGEKYTKKFIDKLNAFKGSRGKTYKSDYLAILNWVVEAVLKDKDREAIQEAKIKEKEWEAKKEKRDDYKYKSIPKKTYEILKDVIPKCRDRLEKLK